MMLFLSCNFLLRRIICEQKQRFSLEDLNEMNTVLNYTSAVEMVDLSGPEWVQNRRAIMNIGF